MSARPRDEMPSGTMSLAVISAGLSSPSSTRTLADRLAGATVARLAESGLEASVDVVELREHAHDVTNALLTGFASPKLRRAIDGMTGADGLIVATPIFSTSYSGLFKSFMDVLDPDVLTGMPVLLAANAGTARHSLAIDYALRPLLTYLHADPVPTGVFAASADWGGAEDDVAPLSARIERGARELAAAMVAGRSRGRTVAAPARSSAGGPPGPLDPDGQTYAGSSFEELLRATRR